MTRPCIIPGVPLQVLRGRADVGQFPIVRRTGRRLRGLARLHFGDQQCRCRSNADRHAFRNAHPATGIGRHGLEHVLAFRRLRPEQRKRRLHRFAEKSVAVVKLHLGHRPLGIEGRGHHLHRLASLQALAVQRLGQHHLRRFLHQRRSGHPHRTPHQAATATLSRAGSRAFPPPLIETKASHQASRGWHCGVPGIQHLLGRAHVIPDAHLINQAGKGPLRHTVRVKGRADADRLDAVITWHGASSPRHAACRLAVQVKVPLPTDRVIGHRRMRPDALFNGWMFGHGPKVRTAGNTVDRKGLEGSSQQACRRQT